MKEYPILFSSEMVKAILAGKKTQTRRVIEPQPRKTDVTGGLIDYAVSPTETWKLAGYEDTWGFKSTSTDVSLSGSWRSPYGIPGDRLWVRETWRTVELESGLDGVLYKADNHFQPIDNTQAAGDLWCDAHKNGKHGKAWRPSIHIYRWMSRIMLSVENVRVERLQDISEEDAIAEGFQQEVISVGYQDAPVTLPAHQKFTYLWDSINGKRGYSFDSNPWVWVIEFKVLST